MRRGMRERAGAVEDAMVEVVELCKGCLDEVFLQNNVNDGVDKTEIGEEERRPKGGEGVLWDTLGGDEKQREAPSVKDFARLSLLGR